MGTGWRRAFRNTTPKDPAPASTTDERQIHVPKPSPSPTTTIGKLGFFTSSSSNPSTPRMMKQPQPVAVTTQGLRCKTSSITDFFESNQKSFANDSLISPKLRCKTANNTPKSSSTKSPRPFLGSNPSSPRSPFSIFKNTLRLSRVRKIEFPPSTILFFFLTSK